MNHFIQNIYLDVDGVILAGDGQQMPHLKEFLTIVFRLTGDNVYWLTTHCRDGRAARTLEYLQKKVDAYIYPMLECIKPTHWRTLKTEAIDLESEFLWFDDFFLQSEYQVLVNAGKEHCLIKVENNLEELVNLFR